MMVRACRPSQWGVQPNHWSKLTVCQREMVAPNGAGSQAKGTGNLAQTVVTAHDAHERDRGP